MADLFAFLLFVGGVVTALVTAWAVRPKAVKAFLLVIEVSVAVVGLAALLGVVQLAI